MYPKPVGESPAEVASTTLEPDQVVKFKAYVRQKNRWYPAYFLREEAGELYFFNVRQERVESYAPEIIEDAINQEKMVVTDRLWHSQD